MMYGHVFTRMKRVSEPLDDKTKARIVGCNDVPCYASSGSAPSDVVLPTFSDLFLGGSDDYCGGSSPPVKDDEINSVDDTNVELIKPIVGDEFQKVLIAQVSKAVLLFSSSVESNRQIMRRNVMAFLRDCGYNAAICKTKWDSSRGLTAGNYEFIDVMRLENSARYFIDLDFASELEIARPMSFYERMLRCIPRVFVGKSEDLKQILKIASGAAMRSMKSRGLPLPPWRKRRFMLNKWLGPYRRITNLYPTSSFSSSAVNCRRTVGFEFDALINGVH